MMKPTVGRAVLFQPKQEDEAPRSDQPYPALICYVNEDDTVNLAGFDHNGNTFSARGVEILQAGESLADGSAYARWPVVVKARKARGAK